MMRTRTLKRCPFCNMAPVKSLAKLHSVMCLNCGAESGIYKSHKDMLKA